MSLLKHLSQKLFPHPLDQYWGDYTQALYQDKPLENINKIIFQTVEDRLKSMPEDGILYVIMGENHAAPLTILPQICLIDHLINHQFCDKDRILYGLEVAYNRIDNSDQFLMSNDNKHRYFEDYFSVMLPITDKIISYFFQDLPTACVDLEEKNRKLQPAPLHLIHDDRAKIILSEVKGQGVCSPQGMYLRNIFMAHALKQTAEQQNSHVVVLKTGGAHVFGDQNMFIDYSPSQSLMSIFNQEGFLRPQDQVLGISMRAETYDPNRQYFTNDKNALMLPRPELTLDNEEQELLNLSKQCSGTMQQFIECHLPEARSNTRGDILLQSLLASLNL